jgi:hypothetical protein
MTRPKSVERFTNFSSKARGSQTSKLARFSLALIALNALGVLLMACGSGASQTSPNPFQNARSESCANTSGVEALYWDFMNGIIRADYPETIRTIPYTPGLPFFHPLQPLYNFIYPSNWQAETLTDSASQLTGANVLGPNGQAVWRRLNYTVSSAATAKNALDAEVQGMLAYLGNPQAIETICLLESPDQTQAAAILRAGDFTANLSESQNCKTECVDVQGKPVFTRPVLLSRPVG